MKILTIAPVYNEGERAVEVVKRFPKGLVDEIVFVNDGSTDGTAQKLAETNVTVLSLPKCSGCGIAIRHGIEYGLKKDYDIFVILAANGKDNPEEISRLLVPLKEQKADFVQGSRYLVGGGWSHMPQHRIYGTKIYSLLFSLLAGKKITDGTNGFRAFRRVLVEDKRVDLWQDWLDGYAVETYLFVQAIRLGYEVMEVPVTKTYPSSKKGYSKMRPWLGWWNHFKPIPFLALRIKR